MILAVEKLGGICLDSFVIDHEHVHLASHDQKTPQLIQARAQFKFGIFLVARAYSITRDHDGKAEFREDQPDAAHPPGALLIACRAAREFKALR